MYKKTFFLIVKMCFEIEEMKNMAKIIKNNIVVL